MPGQNVALNSKVNRNYIIKKARDVYESKQKSEAKFALSFDTNTTMETF